MFEWNDGTELCHHGIKNQKWGIRRFQNEDGSLTPAGKERYGVGDSMDSKRAKSKPHSRTKNVKSGSATDVWTGERTQSGFGGMGGMRVDVSSDVRSFADDLLGQIDDLYDQVINLSGEELKEWAKNNATSEIQSMIELGATKSEIIQYINNLRSSVGSAMKESPSSKLDFENAFKKKMDQDYKKMQAASNTRTATRSGRTSKGYAKVEKN